MTVKRVFVSAVILFVIIGAVILPEPAKADDEATVYRITLHGDITHAMSVYLVKSLERANMAKADGIIIDLETYGGLVDAAVDIKGAILASEAPVVVFVKNRAISAGALITIAADTIVMAPGSHFGAAEPIPFSEKSVAFVSGEFYSTAERQGRDPQIARAMVDKQVEIEGLNKAGQILDLPASKAMEAGYADAMLSDIPEILDFMGWGGARLVEVEMDYKFRIAQFLTRYDVASILLTIGLIAVVTEIFTQGFGLAGIVAIIAYGLYFGGGLLAGSTEWWSAVLFVVGIVLLLIEMAVPGFGAFGIGGIVAMIISVIFAAPDPVRGLTSLGIAIIAAAAAIPVLYKIFGRLRVFDRFVLSEAETPDKGYVSTSVNEGLVGQTGETVTPMRPSGTILCNGERIDAVSDGSYIPAGMRIRIIRAEGTRIVVTPEV